MNRQMEQEWYAWRAMCNTLKALGIDINEEDRLAAAIKHWGEEFVALRLTQEQREVRPARAEGAG